jgi:two-component system NarL family sensor kinase
LIYVLRVNAIRRKQEYLEIINSHQQRLIDSEIRTMERERKRIATDLHDGVGTSLSSIKLLLADSLKARDGERDLRVTEINENLTDVIAEIKRIVYDLRPPALERYGLQVGLKNLAERINNHGGISVKCDYYGHREVSAQSAITIYRIVQELINNTIKHAKATEIRIHVNQFDEEMNLMYEDNGIGMIGSRFNGLGLYSIESRVRSLEGRMTWESNHKGTFYNFDIPY